MSTDRLAAAAASYDAEATRWRHYALRWADWPHAEHDARTHLTALLDTADGPTPAWWFIRKYPCWRIRVDNFDGPRHDDLAKGLDQLVHDGRLISWQQGIYEPETAAFGGADAMAIAHDLFRFDSHAIITFAPEVGRRELSLTLCGFLLRAAGLEWYERGDLWHRVSHERPLPEDITTANITDLAAHVRTMMLTEPGSLTVLAQSGVTAWAEAFAKAGRDLRRLADEGRLQRGLRAVLSYHVIFHWNRMGLPARTQAILARAARTAIFDADPEPASGPVAVNSQVSVEFDRITAAFPLICEPRLHAADLEARIAEVDSFAKALTSDASPEKQIENACTVWNLAALICADCGLNDRAVELCETQFDMFHAAWPVAGRVAIASLQPLINLIRLTRRGGDARAAYDALIELEGAAHHAGSTTIGGRTISFADFSDGPDGLDRVRPWLRTVLLEDGTRALMAAHAWNDAADHAAAYDQHPGQLREGRQTRILALARAGRVDEALALLSGTDLSQPWEEAVAACLRALILHAAGRPEARNDPVLIAAVRFARARPDRATTSFRTRLALTALQLISPNALQDAAKLAAEVVSDITSFGNALCARDALAHPEARRAMTPSDIAALESMADRAYLKAGAIPTPQCDELHQLLDVAGQVLIRALKAHIGQ